jgi:hypothetical protein
MMPVLGGRRRPRECSQGAGNWSIITPAVRVRLCDRLVQLVAIALEDSVSVIVGGMHITGHLYPDHQHDQSSPLEDGVTRSLLPYEAHCLVALITAA